MLPLEPELPEFTTVAIELPEPWPDPDGSGPTSLPEPPPSAAPLPALAAGLRPYVGFEAGFAAGDVAAPRAQPGMLIRDVGALAVAGLFCPLPPPDVETAWLLALGATGPTLAVGALNSAALGAALAVEARTTGREGLETRIASCRAIDAYAPPIQGGTETRTFCDPFLLA